MKQQLPFRSFARLTLIAALAVLIAAPVWAQSRIVQVEEHWELQLGEPDPDTSAPQTTMAMSPTADLNDHFFLFALNHGTSPDYQPGGMQIQLWAGETLVDSRKWGERGTLSHTEEEIRWVQRISLSDGTLKFEIADGSSETWGDFGGGEMQLATSTSLTSLNGYRPGVSLTESQVGYAENRVASLILTKVRWLTDDGQVHEMNAPIPIDTSLDP
jgi:hypothetical protein